MEGSMSDFPKEQQSTQALRETALRPALVVDAPSLKILDCNDDFSALIGTARKSIAGCDLSEFVESRSRDWLTKNWKSLTVGRSGRLVVAHETPRGRVTIEWTLSDSRDGDAVSLTGEVVSAEREGELRSRALFEEAPTGIVLLDPERHCVIEINPVGAGYFGGVPAQFKGTSFLDHFDEEDRALLRARLQRVQHGKDPSTGHATGRRFDGSVFSFGYRCNQILVGGRAVIVVLGRDLSEVKRAEARYQQLFERSAQPILVVSPVTRTIIDLNPAFEDLLGRLKETLLGRSPLDLRHPAHRDTGDDFFNRQEGLPEGSQSEEEVVLEHAGGHPVFVRQRSGVFFVDGAPVLISFLQDITGEKLAEERYTEVFLQGSAPLLIVDASSERVLDANPAFEKLSGFRLEDLRKKPAAMALLDEGDERWARHGERARHDSDRLYVLTSSAGEEIPVSCHVAKLQPQGQGTEMRSLRDLRPELRNAELERSLTQVQKIQSLGQMASGIAHDFNNTLMAALPWADLLRRKYPADESIQKAADQIRRAVHRARDVTRQLLDFAQPKKPQREEIDLIELVRRQLPLMRPVIPPEIEIQTQLTPDTPRVWADPGQLGQLLLNLALNAREAMLDGGVLGLNVRPSSAKEESRWGFAAGRFAILSVSDNGVGMDEEMLDRIFDPFFTTKDVGEGSGLGLAVVHRIVEHHGGFVKVSSQKGRGTSIDVFLPVPQKETGLPTLVTSKEMSVAGLSVLIVDDETAVSEGIGMLLELQGAKVTAVTRGEEALRRLASGLRPSVVVLDLGMPEMSGEKVYAAIREKFSDLPIVISSGYGDRARVDPFLQDPKTRFLQKPYEIEDLLREVAALV